MQCFADGANSGGAALPSTASAEECCLGDGFWFNDGSGCMQCIGMSGLYEYIY